MKVFLKSIRVYQWVKNSLIFLPLLMAYDFDQTKIIKTIMAFFAFSFCASSVYLVNDLLDRKSDQVHPTKKFRPIASGKFSVNAAIVSAALLIFSAFGLAWATGLSFTLVLIQYLFFSTLYSIKLKKIMLMDVFVLGGLYTLRIIAGGHASDTKVSFWLLAFSIFFFSSLAFVKRCSELLDLRKEAKEQPEGRDYVASDLEMLSRFGVASGYLSVLVLALYINSSKVVTLYENPHRLWFLCPLLLYWISRIWLLTSRGQVHQDPIIFALKDKVSYLIGLGAVVIVLWGHF